MHRRRFLALTAAAAATQMSGCRPSGGTSGTSGTPSESDWRTLAAGLGGDLIRPGENLYDSARVIYNARYDAIEPQAVARCRSTDDVREVLAFVRRFGLAVTTRSGGHNYAGYSTTSGVVIDVGPIQTIDVSTDTATIGAGARLADVYDQLTARGVAIPSGSCASIGIAGITQGGGIGVVDRMYGLTCDALRSAEVVTADGRTLVCDADNETDLFWALRGGGGGNFGVVTSFTFATHPTSDLAQFYGVFRMEDAAALFTQWQAWQSSVPDAMWSQLGFWFNDDPAAELQPYVFSVCVGARSDFEPHWNRLLDAVRPLNASGATVSYRDTVLAACGSLTVSQCHLPGQTPDGALPRAAFGGSSDFFDAPVPAAGVSALVQAIRARHDAGKRGGVLFDSMGGAIARVATDATAFVHRRALFSAEYVATFPAGTAPGLVEDGANWAHGMRAVMQPWSNGRAYQNYVDPQITDWPSAYYGPNYARLVRVKAAYDPNGIFQLPQGIPPR
jgi:FAD/FMN-containing dehydrogenase